MVPRLSRWRARWSRSYLSSYAHRGERTMRFDPDRDSLRDEGQGKTEGPDPGSAGHPGHPAQPVQAAARQGSLEARASRARAGERRRGRRAGRVLHDRRHAPVLVADYWSGSRRDPAVIPSGGRRPEARNRCRPDREVLSTGMIAIPRLRPARAPLGMTQEPRGFASSSLVNGRSRNRRSRDSATRRSGRVCR